ncbi:MAG: DUF4185 domain-containing protein [Acidobacteriota bacterium]
MTRSRPEPPKVASIRQVGSAHAAQGDQWALVGQDGGQSIRVGDRSLFVFSDTLLTDPRAGRRVTGPGGQRLSGIFLGNCAAWARDDSSLDEAMASLDYWSDDSGRPREILHPTPLETACGVRLWPTHGIEVDGHVWLYYLGVQQLDPGSWGFTTVGSGLARFDPDRGACERVRHDDEWCLWPHLGGSLHVGGQVVRRDDHLFVFATLRDGAYVGARLARVPIDRIAVPEAYEYLVDHTPRWSPRIDDAIDLGRCAAEISVVYNAYLDRWLMIYVDGFAKQLCVRAAPEIWGPYGDETRIDGLSCRPEVDFVALAFVHPQYSQNDGQTIFISYCQPMFTQNTFLALTLRR